MKSGITIFYYQVNLPDGTRSTAKSIGQSTKAAAKYYCRELEKKKKLIPEDPVQKFLLHEYFKDWWEWGPDPDIPSICPYLTRRYLRNNKPSYANSINNRNNFRKHILPYFGEMIISNIKVKHIEDWLDELAKRGLCGSTQIDILSILRVMLKDAKRLGYLEYNPVKDVIPPRKNRPRKRGILRTEETDTLFDLNTIDEVWNGDIQAMGAFLLAWDTAMRPGEIRAIQRKHIHFHPDGNCTVDIRQAVDHASHRIKETKTGAVLEGVPVRADTAGILRHICQTYNESECLVFSKDGKMHVSENYLKRRLYKALRTIGISEEQRKERNITQYSFRSLAITRLRQQGISDIAVRSLARHTTPIMTDGYTVFNDEESINQIRDFYQYQKNVSGGF
ncbi:MULTISPECIES: site-specific integrase [unclassified Oceanispirochaeta]|uniref:tyrosine-type recombinase/integrase n=1 Tax=unclassified Oceanispirochaeta TaxID=2635722 RepID=UPI000E098AD0|nr:MULTISPECIES: site-specific integrase [unclassified Oceanispirochaeta]MBF9018304.1 tyrosine-type recombinase/integrase family protein [Oceanispirochaeta sp. M2]NPD74769.1 tyrosine-type recombinase/integrase [Oceanispirochaeta sp. M1]RDG29381.1 hypothetical protein DV872_21945 [Oceanispirochaeta sp. M1]